MAKLPPLVYQFRVSLLEIQPEIWRRIQVPSNYNFWDLHVAIQDAMGWLDYHLHSFTLKKFHGNKMLEIGIHGDEFEEIKAIPSWKADIDFFLINPGQKMTYLYDFGDHWNHEVLFEGILMKDPALKYPICLGGERSCPPEDCGSIDGYYEILETLKKPGTQKYKEIASWLEGHAKNYWPYEPETFHPENVKFDNPKKRFKIAFSKENC
ncbi:MAG: plasmid pRiA4b ORF-3 family protein [Candidatus Riflebacteria bacterium]|nr:plasmid pRiA4b ORF-3 family protein [Candidatus Riflebacteria bacterium]